MKAYIVTNARNGRVVLTGTLAQWDEWFNRNHNALKQLPTITKDTRTEKHLLVHPISAVPFR